MTPAALTPDDYRHVALVDELATTIDGVLLEHSATVHAGVLATLLARLVIHYPRPLREAIVLEHLKLAQGLVELLELEAANRQAN
jgi:hypothetical protein